MVDIEEEGITGLSPIGWSKPLSDALAAPICDSTRSLRRLINISWSLSVSIASKMTCLSRVTRPSRSDDTVSLLIGPKPEGLASRRACSNYKTALVLCSLRLSSNSESQVGPGTTSLSLERDVSATLGSLGAVPIVLTNKATYSTKAKDLIISLYDELCFSKYLSTSLIKSNPLSIIDKS